MTTKVSVILTVLNEGNNLRELLDALCAQSFPPDEIVIIDGGSRDGTIGILEDYATRDGRFRVFTERGVNIATGRNSAIRKAVHSIIAVTDGGCRPDVDWLRELVRPLLEDVTIGAVAGAYSLNPRNRFEYFSGLLCMPNDMDIEESRLFYGRSSAFRRSAWEEAGGYPEWLYTAEDTLFALKVRQLGYRIAYAKLAVVNWRPRPSLWKMVKMFYLYGRGNGRITRGNMKGALYHLRNHLVWFITLILGVFFPVLLLVSLATLIYLYYVMVRPVLCEVRSNTSDRWRELYVPVIVLFRNIATNLGYMHGTLEYRYHNNFKNKLHEYLLGTND